MHHARSMRSIALLFSLPFAMMKDYCSLTESSGSFQTFLQQLTKYFYYYHPVGWLCNKSIKQLPVTGRSSQCAIAGVERQILE